MVSTLEPHQSTRVTAHDWFRRFTELYDRSASSDLTEMGLFYDRHRKFVEYGQRSDPGHPEYTDEEWNRVMAGLLGELAGTFGLIQAPDWQGDHQLEWYLPGVTDKPTVVIRETSNATPSILNQDLAELAQLAAELSVFVMYPDYPLPPGATTFGAATRAWSDRIALQLSELRPGGEVLALMISAYSFDLPAPWKGYAWNRTAGVLDPLK